jgi:HAD superfamily hydrolase (TIGR01484 family)
MKKHYKALMLDLDGTTFPNRSDAVPSKKVIDAVKKAQEKLEVCVATGRSLFKASETIDLLDITNPVILLGGAQIIDGKSKKIFNETPLNHKDSLAILEQLKPYEVPILIDYKDHAIHYSPDHKIKKSYTILAIGLTEILADKIIDSLSSLPEVTAHKILSWKHGFFDLNISHVNATKQHGILEVAKLLNIDTQEIIGIGDGPNDLPLLMACGLKVAMGNAVDDLKAVADYVAPTVDDDGVADVIEKFVLHEK